MQAARFANGTEKQTDWNAINWRKANRTVRNLRHRIFRAAQEGNRKRVRSLQKLMLKSYSNRLVSVRRVAQINAGKHTPGMDKLVLKTPAARGRMVDTLAHYTLWKAKPVRRVYIPKANNKLRPLGIPIRVVHYLSFQAMFGIPCVLLLVDQNLRSTFIDLLYHVFSLQASSATLPMSLSRLAQLLDDVWSEGNPAWAMWMSTDALQNPRVTPIGNVGDSDIEQFGCGEGRVASIASLSAGTESRPLWAGEGNGVGNTNPIDFAGGKAASQPWTQPLFIEQGRDLGRRLGWRPLPHPLGGVWARRGFFAQHRLHVTRRNLDYLRVSAN